MKPFVLGNVMVDCRDAAVMQNFYGDLLGWEKCTMYDTPAVKSETGIIFTFMSEPDFVPCTWPEQPEKQQKQMHFDFQVPDVPAAVKRALALGAKKAPDQFGGEQWTTMFDPAGHPFCLCRED